MSNDTTPSTPGEVPMSMRMPSKPADAAKRPPVGTVIGTIKQGGKGKIARFPIDEDAASGGEVATPPVDHASWLDSHATLADNIRKDWGDKLRNAATHLRRQSERIAELRVAATHAMNFIRDEYQAENEDGDLIPDVKARKVYEALVDAVFVTTPPHPSREPQGEVQIQRYFASPFATAEIGPSVTMDKAPDGDWVHYSDHARALASATERAEAAERERDEAKSRRVYYQNIVYHVCGAIDRINGKSAIHGTGVVCGTVDHPSQEVETQIYSVVAQLTTARDESARLRGALEFYADLSNWEGTKQLDGHTETPRAVIEVGTKARAALHPPTVPANTTNESEAP